MISFEESVDSWKIENRRENKQITTYLTQTQFIRKTLPFSRYAAKRDLFYAVGECVFSRRFSKKIEKIENRRENTHSPTA